jgi:hypothetical protein
MIQSAIAGLAWLVGAALLGVDAHVALRYPPARVFNGVHPFNYLNIWLVLGPRSSSRA